MDSILTAIRILLQKKNSKKSLKPTPYFPTTKKDKHTTNWDIQVLTKDIGKKTFSKAPTLTQFLEIWDLAIFSAPFSEEAEVLA